MTHRCLRSVGDHSQATPESADQSFGEGHRTGPAERHTVAVVEELHSLVAEGDIDRAAADPIVPDLVEQAIHIDSEGELHNRVDRGVVLHRPVLRKPAEAADSLVVVEVDIQAVRRSFAEEGSYQEGELPNLAAAAGRCTGPVEVDSILPVGVGAVRNLLVVRTSE